MQGLELSREYYKAFSDEFWKDLDDLRLRASVGLVGEGSQCFGFDDEISRDHDFGPAFCVWLNESDYLNYSQLLKQRYDKLPTSFQGINTSYSTITDRVGIFSTHNFYSEFLGADSPPVTNLDWFLLTENNLAVCTNGEIFENGCREFSEFRLRLLDFYPEDILRKKIAARAAVMAQAGQYNLTRLLKRSDYTGSMLALSRFVEASLSIMYLLNKRYMPFYKWAFRGSLQLKKLHRLPPLMQQLCTQPLGQNSIDIIDIVEQICHLTAESLRLEGYSSCKSDFLQEHLGDIMSGINDPEFAAMHPMADFLY